MRIESRVTEIGVFYINGVNSTPFVKKCENTLDKTTRTAGRDYREGSPLLAVVLFPVMGGAGFGAADLLPWVRCPAAGAVVPGDGQPGPDRDRPGVPWCCGCRCWLLCWCDWGTGQKHFAKHFQNRATGTALCCRWRDLFRRPGGGVALLLVLLAGCAVCGAGAVRGCDATWRMRICMCVRIHAGT